MIQTEQDLILLLVKAFNALQLRGFPWRIFLESVSSCGKPVGEITLAELAELYKEAVRREKEEREMMKEKH